jgi:hypothetical protein
MNNPETTSPDTASRETGTEQQFLNETPTPQGDGTSTLPAARPIGDFETPQPE